MASPTLAVDTVIVYPDGDVILIERGFGPFKGSWALPGGGVEIGETVEQAAVREAKEETGLDIKLDYLIGVYSDPKRDPRGHTVSIVFRATPVGGELQADTDAAKVIRTGDYLNMSLAFDHDSIIRDAMK
ncbi:MAG: NUDIX hydrolase [candidate division Zixibacteria bacterium]|nr:NUDIX hydrolase [candidate division Zixibacteria bacterium]